MKQIIISIIPLKFLSFLRQIISRNKKTNFIQNINWDPNNSKQPKVLISYVTDSLFNSKTSKNRNTRGIECAIIIREFIKKGYCVDIIDCDDTENYDVLKQNEYNLLFGFGKVFNQLNKDFTGKRVMYLTEKHPEFSLKKEKERVEYFKQRHNKKVGLSRSNLYYTEDDFNNLDSIVYIGNSFEADLIPIDVPKFPIKPTGLLNSNYQDDKRNISVSKKNFLWFGSLGAIHKGLDLLIDVFQEQKDCTLYIAGLGQLDKKLLPKFQNSANIIDLDYVNVQSSHFLEIVNQCSFVILPSCSEGVSTGVITCMNHGLIPIVTKEVGIVTAEFGLELTDFKIETIKKSIQKVSNYDDKLVLGQHKVVYDYAIENFSLLNFQNTFSSIINNL